MIKTQISPTFLRHFDKYMYQFSHYDKNLTFLPFTVFTSCTKYFFRLIKEMEMEEVPEFRVLYFVKTIRFEIIIQNNTNMIHGGKFLLDNCLI